MHTEDSQRIEEISRIMEELGSSFKFECKGNSNSGKKLVISDLDEVLVRITYKWIALGQALGLFSPEITKENIDNRRDYKIYSLMDLEGLTDQEKDSIVMDLYKIPSFYNDLELTS